MTFLPNHLSRRERQIMDAVYSLKQASVEQVLEILPDPPSYSSVRALMRILENKGHLRHILEGRKFIYIPIQPHQSAATKALQQVLNTFFGGNIEIAVQTLLSASETRLNEEQLDHIARQIEKAKMENQSQSIQASQNISSETSDYRREREP